MLKLSTKKLLFLLAITCVSVSATNKELYEVNNKNEKKIYKKYDAISGNTEAISNNLTSDLILSTSLFYQTEMDKILNLVSNKNEKSKMKKVFADSQSVVISIIDLNGSIFPKELEGYGYVNQNKSTLSTVAMEAYLFNINSYFEYSKDETSFANNSDYIYDYLYFKGSTMTKEDFKKLNSTEIDAELTKKYKELDNSITNLKIENAKEKNAYIKKYNKSLDTLKKNFKAYNDSYSKLVNSSTYTPEVKVLQENKNNDTEKRLGEIEEAINTQIAPTKVIVSYDDLDIFARLVMTNEEYSQYELAKKEFSVDYNDACKKYISEKEPTSMFSTFFYDYLAKHTNSFLYEYGAPKYVAAIKQLVETNQIELNVDWNEYEEKESKYQEALIDIMTTEINKLLLEKGKILFGINVGDPSALFFITDISNYNVLITRSSNFYSLYNIEYYSQFYGNIFRLNEDISEELKKDDYIEKKDSTYSTLFNETKKEYKDTEITDSKLTKIL